MKRSSFFAKTLLLILSNIITGTITFIFSIVISRKAGSGAMGLYQLVMPLYAFFLCIAGGGVTISVSKITAEEKAKGNYSAIKKTVRSMCVLELLWSSAICVIILLSALFLANNILKDNRTFYCILAFCPAILFISISSVFKGAFYGIQRIAEPAIIDILEKLFRIGLLFVIIKFIGTSNTSLASAGAVLSLSFGELASMVLFYISYVIYFRKLKANYKTENAPQLIANVLKLSIPLAVNGIIATVFSTIITVIIPMRLQNSGLTYDSAISLLGKLQGMALAILFYPAIIISSLNILLIPAISEAQAFKKDHIVSHHINTAFKVASLTAFCTAAIFLAIPDGLGNFFYKDSSIGPLISMLTPGIPFIYLQMTTFAVLNGLGRQTNILINSTVLSIVDLLLLYFLLALPSIGIKGYAIDFTLSSIVGTIINYIIIKKHCRFHFDFKNNLLIPSICGISVYIFFKVLF